MSIMKFLPPQDYQMKNESLFNDLREKILVKLPHARIEHIGASAIPGAYSKGDLDIFVGVPTEDMGASIGAIQELGFQIKSNTLRAPELCMLELEAQDTDIAVQLVGNGSKFEFFLAFRDALLESSELLSDYNRLKVACTGMDHEIYRDKKSKFIEIVLDAH